MANVGPLCWYIRDNAPTSTIGWSAVTAWATGTVKAAGALVRQNAAPSAGNERVFVAIVAGTTHATTEPTWTVTKGAKNTDNTVTWQECTGQPAVNGDKTNTPTWLQNKNTALTLGLIIQNGAGTHYFIVSTAGTSGNGAEPTWGTTAGNTTADNTVTWTCIGAVGNFTAWNAPHARLLSAQATNWGAVGHTFYVGDDHSEALTGSITYSLGAAATPVFIYSIDHTQTLPTTVLASGATISCSTTMTLGFTADVFGVIFRCGTANGALANLTVSGGFNRLHSCSLRVVSTSSSILSIDAANGSAVYLINTDVQFGAVGSFIRPGGGGNAGNLIWRNTSSGIGGATVPTNLFSTSNGSNAVILEGVDFSAAGSGKTLVAADSGSATRYYFVNCQIDSAVTVAATPTSTGSVVDFDSSGSSGIIYDQRRFTYTGTLTPETTIVRTGGATDGITPISWKIVTTANPKWILPFECPPISIWNSTTGSSVNITVYGIWGSGAVPNNDDIWIDVEYLGSVNAPIALGATGSKASNIATNAALSSDSSTWGGSTTAFKTTASFTARLAGWARVYVRAAKASTTFYIDPRPELS